MANPSRRRLRSLTAEDDADGLHDTALRLLARREHAARELAAKLERRGYPRAAVTAELERLAEAGLQSESRFTEQFVEQRVGRGDGPLKIRAALHERGVDGARIDAALEPYEDDWTVRAAEAAERRFGRKAPGTRNERARRARFLQQRGFSADVVRRVTEYGEPDD